MIATLAIRFDVVAIGAMTGLGYAILAAGLVLVYRATKVINLAHGQIGAFAAGLFVVLVHNERVPYAVALAVALATGAAVGLVVERGLVRPLLERSRLAILVATVGVTDLLIVAQAKLPSVIGSALRFPTPVNWTVTIGSLVLHGEHFALLIFGPAVLGLLIWFLVRSRYGLAIRGVADNREAAQLAGVSAARVSALVWGLAGALAAIAAILTEPLSGVSLGGSGLGAALGPSLLLRALAAGLAGGMTSLPATVGAGVAIGVVEAVLYASYPKSLGIVDVVLFVFILVVLLVRSRTAVEPADSLSFGEEPLPLGASAADHPVVRGARRACVVAAVVIVVVLPIAFSSASHLFLLSQIPIYGIIGVSIVMLTGWAGQLSLCQMAFVGIGAMGTAALASRGVPLGAAIAYTTCGGTVVAAAVGAPALRLKGLFLTVTTLGFAVAASSYLLNLKILQSSNLGVAEVTPGRVGPLDFGSFRVDYYVCVVSLLAVILIARRVRSTGVGRALIAVEGNEESAAAMTVSPAAAKLCSFALAGAIATFAGGLLAMVSRTFQVDLFSPDQSLQVLAMTVVGGVGSIAGAVAGALYLVGLPDLLGNSLTVQLATSGIGVLIILRFEPAGLVGIWQRIRNRILRDLLLGGTSPDSATSATPDPGAPRLRWPGPPGSTIPQGAGLVPALSATGVTVAIGGRRIISGVDLEIREDEIVGLIGSNGAGKSTLMNAISGFVASTGSVELAGTPIDDLGPVDRARLGLGRSFQSATLYPRLTVTECVQVALGSRHRSEVIPSILALPPSIRTEQWSRWAAADLLDLLGLVERADQRIGSLSTGTRRVVEFACLLAIRPRVILLDEPMAGIAQRESEAFADLLRAVRLELGAAMLVIEHDMPLVMQISDRIYCLEAGVVIAEGPPAAVRDDPKVIASYLGTDERAVARSGASAKRKVRRARA
jgi:ABC-type branched-subunit amino acid transport system ATPase component/ABC-type branched-subunit amino acid transport system permease subunit